MRRYILLLISAFIVAQATAQDVNSLWDKANTEYVNDNYDHAIVLYDSIVSLGYTSHKLFYNLGNAYFKKEQIGKAILNYNKALLLAPTDKDIKHNLDVANTFVQDKIEPVPEFFVKTWLRTVVTAYSADTWAVLSLVFIGCSLALVLLFLLAAKLVWRKTGFFAAIVFLILFCFSLDSAIKRKNESLKSDYAIIMRQSVSVKSSPDNSSKDIFMLHEGTKVRVISSFNNWSEIQIIDGNKGWLNMNTIEMIN